MGVIFIKKSSSLAISIFISIFAVLLLLSGYQYWLKSFDIFGINSFTINLYSNAHLLYRGLITVLNITVTNAFKSSLALICVIFIEIVGYILIFNGTIKAINIDKSQNIFSIKYCLLILLQLFSLICLFIFIFMPIIFVITPISSAYEQAQNDSKAHILN
ncbi:hypothetical protein CDV26_04205 [Francisella halioticida]|uniref:Uncharacterized protein n=1 Tax=Francisella halioticida TaxID=549298 RepID=A0ABM6LYT4_9GAMM|nr:hypothetical protein CDV26_04205 [Francisella halioticida]